MAQRSLTTTEQVSISQRKYAARVLLRAVLVAALAVVVLGLIAPFIDGTRFSGKLRSALETSLGRSVEFQSVHFTVFSGPGFSLDGVTIGEDPRYGLEPFAYVPTLEARVRLDKLLLGQFRLASIRLVDPSLNLVKRNDGTWNVVEMVNRLSAPRRMPLSLFPALEVSDGRIDVKFGTRKTLLYIADADLNIYPQRSGKVYIQFSGSPARTDRAGNGFSHFRGAASWYTRPASANRLEADITLDESNLSEVTTLLEGHDIGIHGTVTSQAHIAGPLNGLQISGHVTFDDVHRWDLMPASGEEWRIRYLGSLDLVAHRCELRTVPSRGGSPTPVAVQLRVSDFLKQPVWSVMADLRNAPLNQLMPFAARMGITLPEGLELQGSVDGTVGYGTHGLSGGISMRDVVAAVPDLPPLRTASADATILADHVHLNPAILLTSGGGTLRAGGDYYFSGETARASLTADDLSIRSLKEAVAAWFGAPGALAAISAGNLTGQLNYFRSSGDEATASNGIAWSGQFQLSDGMLRLPGLAEPLTHARGHVRFDPDSFDLTRFAAVLKELPVRASYHYNANAKRTERVSIDIHAAGIEDLQAALRPALQGEGLLVRLRVMRRSIPTWLADRNLEGDLKVDELSLNETPLGSLKTHFEWLGPEIQFKSIQIDQNSASLRAQGSVRLNSYNPEWRFQGGVTGFKWGGGLLNADGEWKTSGTGIDSLHNLQASGTFSGEDISVTSTDSFDSISGHFEFSFADGAPNLRLSGIEAVQDENEWNGEALTNPAGNLVFDLAHSGRQMHVVSVLAPGKAAPLPPSPFTANGDADTDPLR